MNNIKSIIVVPCFNEAARLDRDVFTSFVDANTDVAFLFVDDGSTDSTRSALDELASLRIGAFEVASLDTNQGKAAAVRTGVLAALAREPEYVGYWDADLSTPLDEITAFAEVLDAQPQLLGVMGCRVRRLGAVVDRQAARHYLGRIFATVVSLILGVPAYDTQCGAKLFRANADIRDVFSAPFISKWGFDVEVIARLIARTRGGTEGNGSVRLLEFPLPHWKEVAGSKLRLRDMVLVAVDLSRIFGTYRLRQR